MKNIVICGGHLTPALAVIEELEKSPNNWNISYIGKIYASEFDQSRSLEYLTITGRGIPFYPLITGKFQRIVSLTSLLSLLKLPVGFIQSYIYLKKIKPVLVLSFGGFVALPIAVSAWILGIPVITHEQTTVFGLTNRIITRFSRVICISHKKTRFIPSNSKVVFTGIPIREKIIYPLNTGITDFGEKKLPLIYITGGSQGSRSINEIINKTLSELLSLARLLHQCGSSGDEKDFRMLLQKKESLSKVKKLNYRLLPHINPDTVGEILQNADLVISRSGANTVAELQVWQVPAILIPLPWSADNEQEVNAVFLASKGFARILHQENLTGTMLVSEVKKMLKREKSQREYIASDSYVLAAKKIVSVLNEIS